jgi:hypothetical protein
LEGPEKTRANFRPGPHGGARRGALKWAPKLQPLISMHPRFLLSSLFAAGVMTVAVIAQTQSGSANTVDPYAPKPVPKTTKSTPMVDAGTDSPAATPVNTEVQVNAARLAKLDTDKDGRLSLSEFTAGYTESKVAGSNEAGMASGTSDAATVFKQLDADGDSFLSASELANADARQLKK